MNHLPLKRVKTIMKSSTDTEFLSKHATLLTAWATEIFLKVLVREGYLVANKAECVDYKHLAEIVNNDERYEFLQEIIPMKITVGEYKGFLENQQIETPEIVEVLSSEEEEQNCNGILNGFNSSNTVSSSTISSGTTVNTIRSTINTSNSSSTINTISSSSSSSEDVRF